jgi:hypothetical protein
MAGHGPDSRGQQVLIGMQFSDGQAVTNVRIGEWRPRAQPHPDAPYLHCSGGGGDNRTASVQLFLSPLPPPGPVAVYAAWPSMGIAETRHDLDATAIVAAAARAVVLWPDEPDADGVVEQPEPPLNLPPGGWFEHVLRRSGPGEPYERPADATP